MNRREIGSVHGQRAGDSLDQLLQLLSRNDRRRHSARADKGPFTMETEDSSEKSNDEEDVEYVLLDFGSGVGNFMFLHLGLPNYVSLPTLHLTVSRAQTPGCQTRTVSCSLRCAETQFQVHVRSRGVRHFTNDLPASVYRTWTLPIQRYVSTAKTIQDHTRTRTAARLSFAAICSRILFRKIWMVL
eukprot:6209569-Pleurochrysis_carterae.AAC.2